MIPAVMPHAQLIAAIDAVPRGRWAVGVSGGPDSVALLALLRTRPDLSLHVVHLDHQLRGADSDADAGFVADLCRRWQLGCTIARRAELEPSLPELPANPSARYRRLRLALFASVVNAQTLDGVILAHHADDQAETVLQRLLRGSGPMGLSGMSPRTRIAGLLILRPLLHVHRIRLIEHLREIDEPWREDSSNTSGQYLRNRLRPLLARHPPLSDALLQLSRCCAALRAWVRAAAPTLPERFAAAALAELPTLLARESARRWLASQRVPDDELGPGVLDRLIDMSRDVVSPARQDFPGQRRVRRRGGFIFID